MATAAKGVGRGARERFPSGGREKILDPPSRLDPAATLEELNQSGLAAGPVWGYDVGDRLRGSRRWQGTRPCPPSRRTRPAARPRATSGNMAANCGMRCFTSTASPTAAESSCSAKLVPHWIWSTTLGEAIARDGAVVYGRAGPRSHPAIKDQTAALVVPDEDAGAARHHHREQARPRPAAWPITAGRERGERGDRRWPGPSVTLRNRHLRRVAWNPVADEALRFYGGLRDGPACGHSIFRADDPPCADCEELVASPRRAVRQARPAAASLAGVHPRRRRRDARAVRFAGRVRGGAGRGRDDRGRPPVGQRSTIAAGVSPAPTSASRLFVPVGFIFPHRRDAEGLRRDARGLARRRRDRQGARRRGVAAGLARGANPGRRSDRVGAGRLGRRSVADPARARSAPFGPSVSAGPRKTRRRASPEARRGFPRARLRASPRRRIIVCDEGG